MTKIVLVTASVISMGALTACQSTQGSKDDHQARMMDRQDRNQHHNKMSPEQREEMKQMHAQRKQMREQIQKACDGKTVGQSIQVKVGQQNVDGTCNMVFKADRKAMKEMRKNFRPNDKMQQANAARPEMTGEMRRGAMYSAGMKQNEVLTDAKRAELTKQFDQRLAQRQVQQQAIAKACQGQINGKTVEVKFGEQTVNGTCVVKFQPTQQAQNTVVTPASTTTTAKAS